MINSRLFRSLSFLLLLVLLAAIVHFINFQEFRQGLHAFLTARRAALTFADGLRQTSDDLTRMVRLYAITGEPQYREYFDEILAIRNGEAPRPNKYHDIPYWDIVLDTGVPAGADGDAIAMRVLARDAGLTDPELGDFERAEDASNALAVIENEVMEVVAAQAGAGNGEYVLEGAALEAMLRLHRPEYHAAKAQVMRPLVELERKVSEYLSVEYRHIQISNDRQMTTAFVLLGLSLLLLLAGLWLQWRSDTAAPVTSRAPSLLALLAVLVSTALAVDYRQERPNLSAFMTSRLNALDLADGLRQTSDDLTRMVRLYAITGEPQYREYFDEILAIRNGEAPRPDLYFQVPWWDIVLDTGAPADTAGSPVPIRTLVQEAGLQEAEIVELARAEDASNALVELEYEIMDVVAAQIGVGGGEYVLEGEVLQAMLRLHGPEYHAARVRIMEPLVELDRKVDVATAEWRREIQSFYNRVMYIIIALLGLAFLLSVAGMWLQRRWR